MIPTQAQSKEIKKAIKAQFGSIKSFKEECKRSYDKYIAFMSLSIRKQNRVFPMPTRYVSKGEMECYYAKGSNGLQGKDGKGFYVGIYTNVGNKIDFKIA